jgi:hypothetical protein
VFQKSLSATASRKITSQGRLVNGESGTTGARQ